MAGLVRSVQAGPKPWRLSCLGLRPADEVPGRTDCKVWPGPTCYSSILLSVSIYIPCCIRS